MSMLKHKRLFLVLFLLVGTLVAGSFALRQVSKTHAAGVQVVTNTNDAGPGSLRDTLANAASGDTINFQFTSGTITLTSPITILKNLTIQGPAGPTVNISGNNQTQIFLIPSPSLTVSLQNLNLIHGTANGGQQNGASGGAIYNEGTLNVTGIVFWDNKVIAPGAGASGGAIENLGGTMTLTSVTFRNNSVTSGSGGGAAGGAIDNSGRPQLDNIRHVTYVPAKMTITTAIFDSNTVLANAGGGGAVGGAIRNGASATLTLNSSTVTNNSATSVNAGADGGAIYYGGSSSTVTLTATALSGNSISPAPRNGSVIPDGNYANQTFGS